MQQTRKSRYSRIGLVATASLTFSTLLNAATGTPLPRSTLYPRLIRLQHGPGRLRNSILAKTGNRLFRSLDEGRTFTYLATVPTSSLELGNPVPNKDAADKERCCSTLFELPRKLGSLPAGTLLYSGSFFSRGIPAIEIFTSFDQGAHWQYLSTPMKAGDEHHGLWEPAFSTANDGSLLLFVSDETDPCCSQKLVQLRTRDLLAWSPKQDTVASTSQRDRPGMAVVTRLPSQTFLMSYEICGPAAHCQIFTRTSSDGIDFGTASSFGKRAVSTSGQYLAHAPLNIFDPTSRKVVLSGQVLYESDGSVSPDNGRVLFTNSSPEANEPWHTIPAPVEVPTAYDNFCPNYSSALLPTRDGLLELASDFDAAHTCTSYFRTLPRP